MFSTYLPNKVIYQDRSVTDSFQPGKHCTFTFTHQMAEGMTMETANAIADNILHVLQNGGVPPVTEEHARRLTRENLPPGIPEKFLAQIHPLDVKRCNEAFCSAVPKGTIRVESIATCMGCVMATCVMDVENLPKIANGMMSWAKPIVAANEQKLAVCVAYRKNVLEPEHAVAPLPMAIPGGNALAEQVLHMVLEDAKNRQQQQMIDSSSGLTTKLASMMYVVQQQQLEDEDDEEEEEKTGGSIVNTPALEDGPTGWFEHLHQI